MLTVVTWKWAPPAGYHTRYTADYVNRLRSMVARHLSLPHEVVCVTDDPEGLDAQIRVVPLPKAMGYNWHPRRPNCYRRLRAFAADAAEWLGERILSIDLDCVILKDITPLVDRPDDFVIVGDEAPNATPYNGSMWLLRAGTRTKVWETFDPHRAPEITKRAGIIGSDQAWIAHVLGPKEATWGVADGVLGYGRHVLRRYRGTPPPHARVVFFFGPHDPSRSKELWVKDNWR